MPLAVGDGHIVSGRINAYGTNSSANAIVAPAASNAAGMSLRSTRHPPRYEPDATAN